MATNAHKAKTDEERHPERYFNSPAGHIRDRIVINETSDIPKEGQFISLNGYAFLARPEVEIDLPRPVRKMLDTLIRTETTRVEDGKGGYTTHTRNIRRITYRIVQEGVNLPGAEVIAAENAAQSSAPSLEG